jgi:hypothetical protein
MTLEEAADYLRLADTRAARRFFDAPKQKVILDRIGKPLRKRGNALLVHVEAVEAVLQTPRASRSVTDTPRRTAVAHSAQSVAEPLISERVS